MKWLTIDPGETTGWSLWQGAELVDAGQDPLREFVDELYDGVILERTTSRFYGAAAIVCEDWALYPWAAQALIWDSQRTVRGIGQIELIARLKPLPIELQPAKIKEAAVSAGAEELFYTPRHENRHANDAIMHGVYYLALHNNKPPA